MSGETNVIVVMPAYNAAQTLVDTYRSIPPHSVDRVILVDDGSIDDTAKIAEGLDLELIVHPHNAGYGANQKTCYMEALRQGAEIVIMLHPDGQYDPRIIPDMIEAIRSGRGDFVLGSRFLPPQSALAGGMPRYKYMANRFLTAVENFVMGTRLSECHTGYRAYSRRLLETVPFLRNGVSTKYFNEASSISLAASLIYGLKTLWVAGRYLLHHLKVWRFDLFRSAKREDVATSEQ